MLSTHSSGEAGAKEVVELLRNRQMRISLIIRKHIDPYCDNRIRDNIFDRRTEKEL